MVRYLLRHFFFVAESGAKRRMQEHALHICRCIYIYIYKRKICCYYHHTSMTRLRPACSVIPYLEHVRAAQQLSLCTVRLCSFTWDSLLHVVTAFCGWTLDLSLVIAGCLGLSSHGSVYIYIDNIYIYDTCIYIYIEMFIDIYIYIQIHMCQYMYLYS